jgi:hypothetical protein
VVTEEDIKLRKLHPPFVLPSSRYRLVNIINLDETPTPFHFVDDMTNNLKGQKTVSMQTERSGWDKRHATVLLTVNGSGRQEQEVVPLLIFKGKAGGSILKKEGDQYHPGVLVEFNEKA